MKNNDLENDLIEKSILIMKGLTSVEQINDVLGIDDSTSMKWLELAKENIEPYKSYAHELELFEYRNRFEYEAIVKNDFKSFKDNELDFLLEDNYLFSLENTRADKISILKTRVHPENLRDSMENLANETSKLDGVFNLLIQLDRATLINLLDDEAYENASKEEIADKIISDIHIKNIDKLIMNLKSYLSDLDDFNIQAPVGEVDIPVEDDPIQKDDESSIDSDFVSFVDDMMDDFLNALRQGKTEEEAMDISGVNSITLMSWKVMAESGDENYKKFYDEYKNLI